MIDKFLQPDMTVVSRSGAGTLLSPEVIAVGRSRVAAGEDPDEVAQDLAEYEMSLIDANNEE